MTYIINDNGVDRDMTAAEIANYEAAQKSIDDELAAQKQKLDAITAARTSARAKLAALGLTDAEITALLGA